MQISLAVFNCSVCKSPPDVPPPLNYKKLKIQYNKHIYFHMSKLLLQNLRGCGTFKGFFSGLWAHFIFVHL